MAKGIGGTYGSDKGNSPHRRHFGAAPNQESRSSGISSTARQRRDVVDWLGGAKNTVAGMANDEQTRSSRYFGNSVPPSKAAAIERRNQRLNP